MTYYRKDEPSLVKIIVVILLVGGLLLGAYWAYDRYGSGFHVQARQEEKANAVERARTLLDEGRYTESVEMLTPFAEELRDTAAAPRVLMMLASAHRGAGNMDGALQSYSRILNEFQASPERPRAAVRYARLLEDQGRFDEAIALFQEIRETAPPEIRTVALAGLGRNKEREGDRIAARDLLDQAVREAEWDSEEWHEALGDLGRVNVELVFSGVETPESRVYEVERGDSITSIGNKLNITQGMLFRANGLDEENHVLNIGQRLRYTPKDFRIVIERSTCRLFLLDKNGIFKMYGVGLGKPGNETTLGSYKIGSKQKDPTWFKPGVGPIPPLHPDNELGTRWMPLVPVSEDLPTDLGIHGTISPETIGYHMSMGCARMLPDDVEELYDLVVRATPVDIVETFVPEDMS